MQINKVIHFTNIDIAKQFVVDDMVQLWNGDGNTLVITHLYEPYVEQVMDTLYQKKADAHVELLHFLNMEELCSKLESLVVRSYRHIVIFNSVHQIASLNGVNQLLARLMNDEGMLHLSWPAHSLLGRSSELSEIDIAKMVTDQIIQPFDQLRKSDQSYLDSFKKFNCQRITKFDFNLNFDNFDGVKDWHQCGGDLLFGINNGRSEQKDLFFEKLFEYSRLGCYQARMTTTVADFSLK